MHLLGRELARSKAAQDRGARKGEVLATAETDGVLRFFGSSLSLHQFTLTRSPSLVLLRVGRCRRTQVGVGAPGAGDLAGLAAAADARGSGGRFRAGQATVARQAPGQTRVVPAHRNRKEAGAGKACSLNPSTVARSEVWPSHCSRSARPWCETQQRRPSAPQPDCSGVGRQGARSRTKASSRQAMKR